MMENNKYMKKIKILLVFIMIISTAFILNQNKVYAEGQLGEEAVMQIKNVSNEKTGLLPCNPFADKKSEDRCMPQSLLKLGVKLAKIFSYLTILLLVVLLITGAVGYVYTTDSKEYFAKWKKRIQSSALALLYILIGFTIVFALLQALGFKSSILNFIKQEFTFNNFSIFPKAYAENLEALSDNTNVYTNFFPNQSAMSLFLLAIKFVVSYLAAPALVIATVWSGMLFVKAQGKPEELLKAKKYLMRVFIVIVVVSAAYLITTVALNTVNELF